MAKLSNGFLGGFNGRLGPAVGYQWNGVWCLRARARQVHNPRSEAQQAHRALFKQEVQLAARMRWTVTAGLTAVARQMGMTAQNLFVKMNQEAFSSSTTPSPLRGTPPQEVETGNDDPSNAATLEVDWARLQVSAGPVAPVAITSVECGVMSDELTVYFDKNPEHRAADGYDSVYLWIYDAASGRGYLTNAVYRRAKRIDVLLPDYLVGSSDLHLYAFVQDEHGRCSTTAYGLLSEDSQGTTASPLPLPDTLAEGERGDRSEALVAADESAMPEDTVGSLRVGHNARNGT